MKKILLLTVLSVFLAAPAFAQSNLDGTPNSAVGSSGVMGAPTDQNWDPVPGDTESRIRSEMCENTSDPNRITDPIYPLGSDYRRMDDNTLPR